MSARHRTTVRLAGLATVLALLGGATGCSATAPEPAATFRALDAAESERLALMRFRNFDAGVREVSFTVTDAGREYAVTGWVDFAEGLGYATVSAGDERQLLAWSAAAVSTFDGAAADLPPLPPPGLDGEATGWHTSDLLPERSRLHAALATVLAAGSDRPDNPLLLQQTDARWLRSDEIDGVAVDVVAGPTSDKAFDPDVQPDDPDDAVVRYWVDESGLLHRLEVRLGGSGDWTFVEFGREADVSFADSFTGAQ